MRVRTTVLSSQETVNLNVHVKVDDPACLKISEELNAQATEMMKAYNSTNLVNFAGVNDVCCTFTSALAMCARRSHGTPCSATYVLICTPQAHLTLYMTDFLVEHVDAIKKVYVTNCPSAPQKPMLC